MSHFLFVNVSSRGSTCIYESAKLCALRAHVPMRLTHH